MEGDTDEVLQEGGDSEEGDLKEGRGKKWMVGAMGNGKECLMGACNSLWRFTGRLRVSGLISMHRHNTCYTLK